MSWQLRATATAKHVPRHPIKGLATLRFLLPGVVLPVSCKDHLHRDPFNLDSPGIQTFFVSCLTPSRGGHLVFSSILIDRFQIFSACTILTKFNKNNSVLWVFDFTTERNFRAPFLKVFFFSSYSQILEVIELSKFFICMHLFFCK